MEDAVGVVLLDLQFGFFLVREITYRLGIGRGIDMMYELAAQRCATVVYDRTRHIAAHLVRVDVGVEQWIGEGHEDDEDEDALIPQHRAALVIPYIEKVFHDFSVLLYVFEFEERFMITRQDDDRQQCKANHCYD